MKTDSVDLGSSYLTGPKSEAWQPIETAPKEAVNEIILANSERVTVGGWVSDVDHGADWEGQLHCAGWWFLNAPDGFKPTHWMPLPEPPQ